MHFKGRHKEKCTDRWCYCIDDEDPDPICDCGRPGWACDPTWHEEQDEQYRMAEESRSQP